jgi:hypothetical protein
MTIFVHTVAEYLLTLFVNDIDVIEKDDFFKPMDERGSLTEDFQVVAVVRNALIL